jgi:hypothetical protein
MKVLTLVVCLAIFIAGCGSSSAANGSVSTANNVTMQGGQWEYVVTPTNGSITMLLDANLPGTNAQLSATNAQIFQPSQVNLVGSTSPIYCTSFNIDASIRDSNLNGKLSWGYPAVHFADFSGDLAANGQSISSGTYSGGVCSVASGPGFGGPQIKGTVTGYTIAPVNGTYSGTLTNSLHGPDVVTFTIAQNPDFSLKMSGTSVVNGVSTALVGNSNSVTGALVFLQGTTENVNGSNSFDFSGHVNPTATQLTVALMNLGPTETLTGALTKQ